MFCCRTAPLGDNGLREIREKSQKNTHFSWKMSQISNCRFLENSKSTDLMVDKYLTRMLVLSKEILSSRLFFNMHLTVPGELD